MKSHCTRWMRAGAVGLMAAASLLVGPLSGHAATSYTHFKDRSCGYGMDYPSTWSQKHISGGYLFADATTNMVLTSQCVRKSADTLGAYYNGYWQKKGFTMDKVKHLQGGTLVSGQGKISGERYYVEVLNFKKSSSSTDAFQFLVPLTHLKRLQPTINHIIDSIQP